MKITPFEPEDFDALFAMGLKLWPDSVREDYERITREDGSAVFLCRDERARALGFVYVSLRHEYVEGALSSPVGYIEGLYVESSCRRQGIGRLLIDEAEAWAAMMGCSELGSDAETDNRDSLAFHQRVGFEEANRIVSFIKRPIKAGRPHPRD